MKKVFGTICIVLLLLVLVFIELLRLDVPIASSAQFTHGEAQVTAPAAEQEPIKTVIKTTTPAPAEALPTPEPTPEPPKSYTISCIGDCTLWSNANYAYHPAGFAGVMGEDYAYPFSNTLSYFESDDCTLSNLECILSDKSLPVDFTWSTFSFIAPTAYANVMSEGGVNFVTVANNHILDCYQAGVDSTCAALEDCGIPYGKEGDSQLFTTESGLVMGIYTSGSDMAPHARKNKALEAIADLREQGAEYIVCMFHWGQELYYSPDGNQTDLAHACIDAGADLIYGSHSHCLQPIEEYEDGLILYSLGNWSFGGSTTPSDPDTAIIQVRLHREADGSIVRDGYDIIPCCVTSKLDEARIKAQNYNDYCPTPYPEDCDEYYRVLSKLDGSFEPTSQGADYSAWYASRATE